MVIDYGDGSSEDFELVMGLSQHTYSTSGTYTVTLTAENDIGGTATKTFSVDVIDLILPAAPPIANFTAEIDDSLPHVTFYFEQSIGLSGDIVSVHWDHGDGTAYFGNDPVHVHAYDPGSYLVTLTVTDSNGLQNAQTQRLVVHESGPSLVASIYCDPTDTSRQISCEVMVLDRNKELSEVIIDWRDGTETPLPITNKEWMTLYGQDHTFAEDGLYNVRIIARNSRGEEVIFEEEVNVGDNKSPIVAFNCHTSLKTIYCDGSFSYDLDGFITNFEWNMGDGQIYESNSFVSHTYQNQGYYNVTLTAVDNLGKTISATQVIPVFYFNQPPIATLDCQIDSFNKMKVNCNGSESLDSDGTITNYHWDFGDGTIAEGPSTSYTYKAPGVYNISLKVIDDASGEGVASTSIKISSAPSTNIACNQTATLTLNCNAYLSSDSDGEITRYSWTLSDGTTYSGAEFTHTFSEFGTKAVVLTLTDDTGSKSYAEYEHLFKDPSIQPLAIFAVEVDHDHLVAKMDASFSLSDGRAVTKYIWTVDGESPVETIEPIYTYPFGNYGEHNVTMTVVDQNSQRASSSQTFKIFRMPVSDPGEAGLLTLEGIDSDDDGVRDDIQRLIVIQADGTALVQSALTSIAKNMQRGMAAINDITISKELTHKGLNYIRCLDARVGNDDLSSLKYRTLAANMFNTRERFLAHAKMSINFSGEIVSGAMPEEQYASLCE